MTLQTQIPRVVITGNGGLGPYSLVDENSQGIRFLSTSHVKLTRYASTTAETGTVLVKDTDFTVGGTQDARTFTLIGSQDALTSSQRIVAERSQTYTQDLDLTTGGGFNAESVEARLDKYGEYLQELKKRVDSSIKTDWRETSERVLPLAPTSGVALLGRNSAGAVVHATAADFGDGTAVQADWPALLGISPIWKVVTAYGAVGNFTTNDATAINLAITAAGAYGVVYFPYSSSGYGISSALIPLTGQTWIFVRGARLKPKTSGVNLVNIQNNYFTCVDGYLDGNATGGITNASGFVISAGVTGTRLIRPKVRDMPGHGIAGFDEDDTEIENMDISGTTLTALAFSTALSVERRGPTIRGGVLDRSAAGAGLSGGGIQVYGKDATYVRRYVRIEGVRCILPNNPSGSCMPFEMQFSRDWHVTANTSIGGSTSYSMDGAGCIFQGNRVLDFKNTGLETGNGSDDMVIDGNVFDGGGVSATSIGTVINGQVVDAKNMVHTNNTYRRCGTINLQMLSITRLQSSGNTYNNTGGTYGVSNDGGFGHSFDDIWEGGGTGLKAMLITNSVGKMKIRGRMGNQTQNGILIQISSAMTCDHLDIDVDFDTVNTPIGTALTGSGAIGSNIRLDGDGLEAIYGAPCRVLDYLNGLIEAWVVTGSPEGVVGAKVGSTCRRGDGGVDTTFYSKTSGSSNTGWTAMDNV